MAPRNRLDQATASEIAVRGLQFLASDPAMVGRFLAITGIGPGEIREAAREPEFLIGVLEYFLEDESLLLAFSSHSGVRPTMIAAARFVLAGEPTDDR